MLKKTIWTLLVLFSLVIIIGGGLFYQKVLVTFDEPLAVDEPQQLLISKGTSAGEIHKQLGALGYKIHPLVFKLQLKLSGLGHKLQAGEYQIELRSSLKEILSKLAKGDVILHRITIPEGFQSIEIINRLNAAPFLSGAQLTPLDVLEGSVLPESYDVTLGTTRQDLLKRMQLAQENYLKTFQEKALPEPLKNREEVVILASLVELETALMHERPLVASVFLNRLRKGMPLQCDPTVVYALEQNQGGVPLERRLLRADLSVSSPFNTYLNKGLPPTPICHPGKASLLAVLNPKETDYLYFVSNGQGAHVFSNSYKNHSIHHDHLRILRKEVALQEKTANKRDDAVANNARP